MAMPVALRMMFSVGVTSLVTAKANWNKGHGIIVAAIIRASDEFQISRQFISNFAAH